jgi:hypothetical protein
VILTDTPRTIYEIARECSLTPEQVCNELTLLFAEGKVAAHILEPHCKFFLRKEATK